MDYGSFIKSSSGVSAVTKSLAVNSNSLSLLTNIAGRFSYAKATWIASMGVREVSDCILFAKRRVISLGTSIFKNELILVISVSITVLVIFLFLLKNERNSIMLIRLDAPFIFLFWMVRRIFSTAGQRGLAVRDSFSCISQLIKTSVSRKIRLLESTIAIIPHGTDDFGAVFTFFQCAPKFSRQRYDYIRWFSFWNFVYIGFKCFYCFLKSWTHCVSFWKKYNICMIISQGYN